MITHLDPDNLECKVKWALGSITTNKASGGDGIPVEIFLILFERWCCESTASNMPANLQHSSGHRTVWKRSVFIPIPKKGKAKDCWNYHTTALISQANKVMLKYYFDFQSQSCKLIWFPTLIDQNVNISNSVSKQATSPHPPALCSWHHCIGYLLLWNWEKLPQNVGTAAVTKIGIVCIAGNICWKTS